MNAIIFIQQRLGSTRFPRKAVQMIGQDTMTGHVVERAVVAVEDWRRVVVGVPYGDLIHGNGVYVKGVGGDERDLMQRMFHSVMALENTWSVARHARTIVRLTGDCPLVPPDLIQECIMECERRGGYVETRSDPSGVPNGLDVQAMDRRVFNELKVMWGDLPAYDREHITPALLAGDWPKYTMEEACGIRLADIPYFDISVDTPEDLERVRRIHKAGERMSISWNLESLLMLERTNPELFE